MEVIEFISADDSHKIKGAYKKNRIGEPGDPNIF